MPGELLGLVLSFVGPPQIAKELPVGFLLPNHVVLLSPGPGYLKGHSELGLLIQSLLHAEYSFRIRILDVRL